MLHTFSGNSKRPRNVNLSGRTPNPNPFAKAPDGAVFPRSQNALASAQQNRLARQQERERTQAATVLQRTWRGYVHKSALKNKQRKRWDEEEIKSGARDSDNLDHNAGTGSVLPAYENGAQCLAQLELLLRFLNLRGEEDFLRLRRLVVRLRQTVIGQETAYASGPWPAAYLRLQDACLDALDRGVAPVMQSQLLEIIRFLMQQTTSPMFTRYYSTLRHIAARSSTKLDLDTVMAPLQTPYPSKSAAYRAFSEELLQMPKLQEALGGRESFGLLASSLDCRLVGRAIADYLREKMKTRSAWLVSEACVSMRLWLLSHVLFFYRHNHSFTNVKKYASERDFIFVTGTLLSSLVDHVEVDAGFMDVQSNTSSSARAQQATLADAFVRDQISSLVNQESVAGALTLIEPPYSANGSSAQRQTYFGDETRLLANYILALLRLFQKRGDEIRMWLYLGSSSVRSEPHSHGRLPVIRYFWQAASNTEVYDTISRDPRAAIVLLKARRPDSTHFRRPPGNATQRDEQTDTDDQWRVILIFIELYMFVLKVMDDEEFFSGGRAAQTFYGASPGQKNALLLGEIEALTLFLKNLGFTMYYNARDISEDPKNDNEEEIGKFFRVPKVDLAKTIPEHTHVRSNVALVAGVQGMTLDYVKGLVTGLLRAVYERDSRRPFLPKGHWLMTSRFDMTNFIEAVVEEEERRHKVQEEDDEDNSAAEDEDSEPEDNLVGTWHAQRTRRITQLQRQQRKAARKRHLQSVAPRLEILQNMPFLIPFTTRVQIFRRFVNLDQLKRRNPHDPSIFGIMPDHGRHHAKIRREHEFEDAYGQFYELGAALKDPIRITFVDQFDTIEAGIDGGGVTKEFLTSVTNQAFAPTDGINMFAENDQHLLFPNPSAVDDQKELLREAGVEEGTPEYRENVAELLRRYEFLGRIIGKCLYEGILVDIGFAGFFLLKWALTGGSGSAPRESGYRANLNDLRDFDEGLYQGLLQLKNYPGDVEDFSLNFTVTDTISNSTGKTRTITRDLTPSGSTLPVTNANRLVYISYVARHRLTSQPALQTSAFLRGLASIIQPSWLSMFNQSELQTLVGGAAASISVPDLRANTVYGGVYVVGDDGQEHPSVRLFWQVMEELEEAERRMVLKFVTSTPRAPLLGFASLNPRFSIRDAGDDEARLPSTSTCVNLLKLPRYRKREVLRAKLLQAVNAGAGFDLS